MLTKSSPRLFNRLALAVVFFILNGSLHAQDGIPQVNYDVSSQTRYLSDQLLRPQVNNSGTVDISIPLYTVICGKLKIPIMLSYNTGGVRVSQRPSIVGLGWNLNCGGVITRIIKGNVDEYSPISNYVVNTGLAEIHNAPVNHDFTYFGNHTLLNRSDWNTSSFADAIRTSAGYAFSGDLDFPDSYPQALDLDLAPDEYDFSITNGISGSFFMDHNGQWKVRSNQAVKVVEVDYGEFRIPPTHSLGWFTTPNSIYQIKLMDEAGNLYTFGHTTEDPSSIEFSRGTAKAVTGGYDARGYVNSPAVAWYLTQVKTPGNDVITYNYKYTFQLFTRLQSNETNLSGHDSCYGGFVTRSVTTTPMIQSITTSQGATINFVTSASTQLDNAVKIDDYNISGPYGCNSTNSYNSSCFYGYGDMSSDASSTFTVYQLNEIKASYGAVVTNDYKFNFTGSATSRLHLQSVDFLGNGNSGEKQTFSFTYNPTLLPGYNSGMEDLLGYYNGSCFFCTFSGIPSYNDLQTQYLPSRAPNSSLMGAESLTSITNPYGGTVTYYTEPHYYSNMINAFAHSFSLTSSPTMAGGLRVSQIVANPNDGNSSPRVTIYHYVQNWMSNPSGPSSGTLYDDISSEILAGNSGYYQCTHLIGSSRKTGELPVAYSEITEEEPGNGYTVRKFSSYTSGQTDSPPFYIIAGQIVGVNVAPYAYDNRKLTRGNLKSEQFFNSGRQLLRETDYSYKSDGSDPLSYVRSVQYLKDVYNSSGATVFSFVAYPQYYYPNTLISKTVTDYDYSHNPATAKTMTESITYDPNYPCKVTGKGVIDSKGNTRATVFSYPFNYANGTGSIYDAMVNQNVIGPVIDEQHTISYAGGGAPVTLSEDRNEYQQWSLSAGNFLNPSKKLSTYGAAVNTSDYNQTDATFVSYDNRQNLLEFIPRNGVPNSYEWGYNGLYPTVKIVNASNSFENIIIETPTTQSANFQWATGDFRRQSITFLKTGTDPVTLQTSFTNSPGSGYVDLVYSITGPITTTGEMCLADDLHPGECNHGSYATITGLPPGNYTLEITPIDNETDGYQVLATYPTSLYSPGTTGIKEFFNENFEESTSSGVVSGTAHTGVNSFNGSYNVGFTPPNGRKYVIQWWNLVNGSWNFNEQPYTGPFTLNGALDDIRIFPADALMNTYTYLPMVGISSELDPAGHCTTYEYDNLNRISLVRDKDKNIVKKFCYDYAGQPMSCTGQ